MGSNVMTRFLALLPARPLIIVTVGTLNIDGTSTVTTSAGGVMRVMGTGVAVGKKAFVRDGEIIGDAPNLTHYDVTV